MELDLNNRNQNSARISSLEEALEIINENSVRIRSLENLLKLKESKKDTENTPNQWKVKIFSFKKIFNNLI